MNNPREEFQRRARDSRATRKAAKKLAQLAETLTADIEDYIQSGKPNKKMYFKIATVKTREDEIAIRSLKEYEESLHEICAAKDVYIDLKNRGADFGRGPLFIVIDLDNNYAVSPDAPPPDHSSRRRRSPAAHSRPAS